MIALMWFLGSIVYLAAGVGLMTLIIRFWSRRDPGAFAHTSSYEENEHIFFFALGSIFWPFALLGFAVWGIWALGERLSRHFFAKALSHDS